MNPLKRSLGNSSEAKSHSRPKRKSLRALDRLNLSLGDVRDVFEPYLASYLAADRRWDQSQVGLVLATTNIAAIMAQTPIGAIVDQFKFKRLLVATAMLTIALSYSLVTQTELLVVLAAQCFIGVATVTVIPTVNAISLGLVGTEKLERRIGRNEVFNRTGNAITATLAGGLGFLVGRPWIFGLLIVLCFVSVLNVYQIRDRDIDQTAARADDQSDQSDDRPSFRELLSDRRLLNFSVAVVAFYAANAALLPLVSQQLAGGSGNEPSIYVSACVVVAQLVMIPITSWTGQTVDRWGRKPLALIAFAAVIVRAVLYTLNQSPWYLVSVQALDGIGAGIFAVLVVVVVADLTEGTGRFNFAQGLTYTMIGIGTALSNLAIGILAKMAGYTVGFSVAAAIALVGLAWYWFAVPETRAQQ